jgi:hypothetical protein
MEAGTLELIIDQITMMYFFFLSWDGVRLSPLGMAATIWSIVPVPDDGWWVWSSQWNDWQGKSKYLEKTCLSSALSTTNLILPALGSNPGHCDGKSATNHLSYGMVLWCILVGSH